MRKGLEEDLGPEAATPGPRGTVRRGEATQLPWDLEARPEGGLQPAGTSGGAPR